MEQSKKDEILKILFEKEIIDENVVKNVEKELKNGILGIEDILLKNSVDVENITRAKAQVYKIEYIDLSEKKVLIEILNIVSLSSAENYQAVCFDRKGNVISVGIADPENLKAFEAIDFLAKKDDLDVKYYLISGVSFDKIFKQYKNLEREVTRALETKAQDEAKVKDKDEEDEVVEDVMDTIKSAPVAKIVSVIIRHAVEGRASDIHIEPSRKESRIRYRIDGVLHTSLVLPMNVHNSIISRIKVMASMKLDETRIPQDGRIRLKVDDNDIDFRVSVIPLTGQEKVVMRILDTSGRAPELEKLGFSGRSLRVVKENIKETVGMFLVTGPTGSGKSTTLFSILNMLNQEGVNISTLEDPVEYFVKGVNQSQIRPEIGFTFAGGLRSLLRQDPDIIMVGEIRDNETAELAIHAGLTGHFVLSTLHTNSAIGTIPRLLDMKVEPFLLGSTLNIIVAQRLARKICPHCEVIKDEIPEDLKEMIEKEIKKMPEAILKEEFPEITDFSVEKLKFVKGAGCSRCGKSGYAGRIAIVEVLDMNSKMKEIIMDEKKNLTKKDIKESQDFTTMVQDGIVKAAKGVTTMEEVLRIIRE